MAITCVQSKSVDAAIKYFTESLSVDDYYFQEAIKGTLHGGGADILGLEQGSEVTSEIFGRLLRGHHPETNEFLGQRVVKNRRPCLDLTMSPPKSVSALHAITGDNRILDAFREAVDETMERDVEPLASRRVRTGEHAWSQQQKVTGNLIYTKFLHRTARPVDGVPDPHLHYHCIIFNHTTDEGKHYALEPETIFKQRYSLQQKMEARLARKLKYDLGYEVEQVMVNQKQSWEIKGVSRDTVMKFSNRKAEIDAYAKEHGITDPKKLEELSIETREKKTAGQAYDVLVEHWRERLSPAEQQLFDQLRSQATGQGRVEEDERALAKQAVDFALQHHLHNDSTVEKHTLVGTAAKEGLFLTPEQIETALERDDVLKGRVKVRGIEKELITTLDVYSEEQEMIGYVRDGMGRRQPLVNHTHEFVRGFLNDEQREAVEHILKSRDTVIAIAGGAGTGKSSLLEEAREAIEKSGKQVFAFAPSSGAAEVLEEKGFQGARTTQYLTKNQQLQAELKDQVMFVDEAALMDVRSMASILKIGEQQNCRVILVGDVNQHNSPRRGEGYRILQEKAGLNAARVEKIYRQQGQYKRAVEMIALGDEVIDKKTGLTGIVAGWDMLDRLGKIQEINGDERHEVLTQKYLENSKGNWTPLVISPSHAEGDEVTEQIRSQLMQKQSIGEEKKFDILRSLYWSDAEKAQAKKYQDENLVLEFHQNSPGFKRGERYEVVHDRHGEPSLKPLHGGRRKALPTENVDRFEVYRRGTIKFGKGDKIRFTLGGKAADGRRRINNGRLAEVSGFDRQGNLLLSGGLKISKDYGHWDHGYVRTSFASQGSQSKLAMAAMGSDSLPAINAKQLYVTASRGEDDCLIYVDDKDAVRRAIQNSGERMSATELIEGQKEKAEKLQTKVTQHRRRVRERAVEWWQRTFRRRPAMLPPQLATSPKPSTPTNHHPAPGLSRS